MGVKVLLGVTVLTAAACAGIRLPGTQPEAERLAAGVTITRDAFGIPTIDAADDAALAFGLAYAMAEDGLPAIDSLYAAATGLVSADWGGPVDRLVAGLQTAVRARAEYARESASMQSLWAAYAAGLNYYTAAHPRESRWIAQYEPWMVIAAARHLELGIPLREGLEGVAGDEALVYAFAPPAASGPPVLLASGRRTHPYEMQLRTADGWTFHGFGSLGLAWPAEGFGPLIAYAHAAPASAGLITGVRGDTMTTVHDTVIARDGRLAQLYALSRSTDSASFAAARAQRSMLAPTVFIDRTTAVLFAADGSARHAAVAAHAGDRAAAAVVVLTADQAWTMDDLALAAFDRRVFGADAEIAALVEEWEQAGARNPDRAAGVDALVTVLTEWDRVSRGGSEAMTLYAAWHRAFEADSTGALPRFRALETARGQGVHNPPRPWEAVNRIIGPAVPGGAPPLAIPVAGGPGRFGIMFAYDAERDGQHYVWLAEAGTGRGLSVVSEGQSARAASRHSFDQAALFATARLRPVAVR